MLYTVKTAQWNNRCYHVISIEGSETATVHGLNNSYFLYNGVYCLSYNITSSQVISYVYVFSAD